MTHRPAPRTLPFGPSFWATVLVMVTMALGASCSAHAADSSAPVQVTDTVSRLSLDVFAEMASLSTSGKSISSQNFGLGVKYALSPSFALGINLSQAFASIASPQALYIEFRTKLNYALWGRYTREENIITIDRTPTVVRNFEARSTFSLFGGLDQYYFNGSSAVAPGSGVSFGASYDFRLFGLNLMAALSSGMIFINQDTYIPKVVSLGTCFAF